MKLIIKLFPEIMIKSRSIRLYFIKILTNNIKYILTNFNTSITVIRHWDHIVVYTVCTVHDVAIIDILSHIPGIHHILEVQDFFWSTIDDIYQHILIKYHDTLIGKSFCVRVKRRGNHDITSHEFECYIGNRLNQDVRNTRVNLTNPDENILIEIHNNQLSLIIKRFDGIGGFPIGTQGSVLSLISGGFDSSVSSYMLLRRGCCVNYCFFNLGGFEHEFGVKQIAHYVWKRYGFSHKVYFITIDFIPIMNEIILKIEDSYRSLILKRMMIRAASAIAEKYNIQTIVTGESLGQVSSQTLVNLYLIDNISNMLILRPLIAYDKEQIIKLAREIGTEKLTYNIPEYCSFLSKKAIIATTNNKLQQEEHKINFNILNTAILQAKASNIRTMQIEDINNNPKIETTNSIKDGDIILDIRSYEEQQAKPLIMKGVLIQHLPFYKLNDHFYTLDQNKCYLLYCDQGIMSYIQALYLYKQGYCNIKIYQF